MALAVASVVNLADLSTEGTIDDYQCAGTNEPGHVNGGRFHSHHGEWPLQRVGSSFGFGHNRVMAQDPPESGAAVQIFLIADIRGYTRFTQDHGDAAAGRLASKFAAVVAEVVGDHGGRLMELRGDEALVSFGSPRLALSCSVELQKRFLEETTKDPRLPLGVGMGLDVGEAVPVEEGYRGAALNVAARLCARATPGEIFATREVTHLARTLPNIRYEQQRPVSLKGLDAPVHAVKVAPVEEDLAVSFRRVLPVRPDVDRGRTRRRQLMGVTAIMTVALIAATVALRSSHNGLDIRAGVGRVDAESSRLLGTIDAPSGAVTSGPGGVWVAEAGGNSIFELDAAVGRVVETVEVGSDPSGLTFGFGALWVANAGAASVSRVNIETKFVVQTVDVGNAPSAIAAGEGSVWVANRFDDTVSRLDPSNGRVTTIDVDHGPAAITVDHGYVWVANELSSTVSKIDPASNEVSEPIRVGNGPRGIVASGEAVWVSNAYDGTASRIDPDTDSVTTTLPVGARPSAIAATDEFVWVASEDDATLTKIDARRGERLETLPVGGTPTALAARGESLWVSVLPSVGHRGGTLHVVGTSFDKPGGSSALDPAIAYAPENWSILTMTNDGLIEFKRVGGADGTTIVPNLAVSLPSIGQDGRSYTFELRDDVRFSTGQSVSPSDVRSSMERVVRIGSVDFYDGIVGAATCRPKKPCDLSRGIVADDETNSVTFKLVRPDPEFLYKLALPFGSVVPQGTPDHLKQAGTVVGTGPYRISDYRVDERVLLVRNDYFEPWAPAAQSDGYADVIDVKLGVADKAKVEAVRNNEADVMLEGIPAGSFAQLRARFADRLYLQASANSFYMFLNTREPPFDDVTVRRAVNFAVDRERIAQLFGGLEQATLTCQIIPPNFPGYRRWCDYTEDPNKSGIWSAPDLAKAQRLVARSGTEGTRVVLLEPPGLFPPALGRYFVHLLDAIGFEGRVRRTGSDVDYFEFIADSSNHAQMGPYGWFMDYPAPSNFFLSQFRCSSFERNDPFNINVSRFCDRSIDKMIASALKTQQVDPAASLEKWAAIDRSTMERAPVVPMVNLSTVRFVSDRVANVVLHPVWGLLLDQLWVM